MMNKMTNIIFSVLLAFAAANVYAVDVSAPSGATRNLTANDFLPHQNSAKEFNETWSYQFVFDNGTRAFVNYSTLYVPASGKKVGCDLTFWNFKSKTHAVGRQYPPERLKVLKEKTSIDIKGEYAMEGKPGKGHRVYFTADKEGKFFLDLTFESAEQGKVNVFPMAVSRAASATTKTPSPLRDTPTWTRPGKRYRQRISPFAR